MIKCIITLITCYFFTQSNMKEIYTFSTQTNIKEWRIVNDGVMGGISKSSLSLTEAGNGQFSGHVSLENNGGFASIQLDTKIKLTEDEKFVVLRIKGDGKRYELRLKGKSSQYESYVYQFITSGKWQKLKLPISEFYPQFRGQQLNIPNFNFSNITQVSFLIANKEEEDFKLLIDWISLE
ncbi:MAG: CIA30 family protein [Bacteroidetes bacterium]|nr:MAG: CIA30 family protein [Bacteroidota bacterium]TAG85348.1 MAG: CIA30 family protein [Bacteroidota bacterium]